MLTILFALLGALVAAWAYRFAWLRLDARGRVPTGFGVFLAPAMLVAALLGRGSPELVLALAAATVGSLLYWLDDAKEMSARVRVVIATITGGAIGAAYFMSADVSWLTLAALVGLAAFVHLALVNTYNMQDGADLNLATFILLTGIILMICGDRSGDWWLMALTCLVFTAPFAILNARPKQIYFGDSGSFAFAALFTVMGAAFLTKGAVPPEAAIPAGLPLVDMIFVTAHRIRIRQRFTVRHYFHLYQRLQSSQPGFAYLVPQLAGAALALALCSGLQLIGVDRFLSVVIGIAIAAPLVFWVGHRFFVSGEPGPPGQKSPT